MSDNNTPNSFFRSILSYITRFFTSNDAVSRVEYLAFFRIAISLIALIDVWAMSSDFKLFFSQSETIIPQELTFLYSTYFNYLHPFYTWLKSRELLYLFYDYYIWIYFLMLICLLVGLFTRITTSMALILQLVIFKSFDDYNYGYDNFLTISLFYCIVFPVGKLYSLDKLLFFKNGISISNFNYARVLQLHLCMVYLFAGLPKLLDLGWWNGKSMWKALVSVYNDYQMLPPYLFMIAGIGTVLLEILYPVLMYIKKTQKVALVLIICMHIGIAVIMDLYSFAAIMIALNLSAWYHLIPFFHQKQAQAIGPATA